MLLRRELGGIDGRRLAGVVIEIAAATACMAGTATTASGGSPARCRAPARALQALRLGVAIGLAIAVLAAAAKLLRLEEFDDALAAVGARSRR